MSLATWRRVVAGINASAGTGYELDEQLPGGQQGGAWVVVDHSAQHPVRRVLTWTANPGLAARRVETARIVDTLCQRGYPTPAWRDWGALDSGIAYVVADLAPGQPGTWATAPVEDVVAAVELQTGAAGPSADSWSTYMAWALTADGGPRQDLAQLGPDAARLLQRIDVATAGLDKVALPTDDAVHGDLGIGNILIDPTSPNGRRIAIIDIDACGPGTRAIDYAWLHRDAVTHAAASAANQFEEAGRAVAGDDVWRLCLSLACLELAAFVARNGTPKQVAAEVARMNDVLASGRAAR